MLGTVVQQRESSHLGQLPFVWPPSPDVPPINYLQGQSRGEEPVFTALGSDWRLTTRHGRRVLWGAGKLLA